MRLDLNLLLYALLFLIVLGLFLTSLLKRRREEGGKRRGEATAPGVTEAGPAGKGEEKAE